MRVRVFALALIGVWVAGAGADSSAPVPAAHTPSAAIAKNRSLIGP